MKGAAAQSMISIPRLVAVLWLLLGAGAAVLVPVGAFGGLGLGFGQQGAFWLAERGGHLEAVFNWPLLLRVASGVWLACGLLTLAAAPRRQRPATSSLKRVTLMAYGLGIALLGIVLLAFL